MKKVFLFVGLLAVIVISSVTLLGCNPEPTDEDLIEDRINGLASAINANDYVSFMIQFHDDCQYQASYTSGNFTTDFSTKTYSFSGFSISVNGSDGNVSCTASVTDGGTTSEPTTFSMKKDGDDWYIWDWYEDGGLMFKDVILPVVP